MHDMYVYQMMGVCCDLLNSCPTPALHCQTGQNKGRYWEKELSFLFVLLVEVIPDVFSLLHCKVITLDSGINIGVRLLIFENF